MYNSEKSDWESRNIDNSFSSPDLFDDLNVRGVKCCWTVRQNCKGMMEGSNNKIVKLKQNDIHTRVRGNLTASIWKDG
jgi:hypothetical protein